MACCCKINTKGVFGIIFSNAGFALLLASFLSCYWLTSPLPVDEEDSTPTAGLVTTAQIATTTSSTNESDRSGLIRCIPASIHLWGTDSYNNNNNNNDSFLRYVTYVATIASLIAALSLLALGDIFLSVYCGFCCCCTCGIITAGGLHIASSLFNFLGCGVYTYGIITWNDYQYGEPSPSDFGWAFYAAWISGLITFISGLLETQGVNANDYVSPSRNHMKKGPDNVVYQPRATVNPAYDF